MTYDDSPSYLRALYASRPDWVKGTLSSEDAHFLYERAMVAPAGAMVEIGTASGFSTAVICTALEESDPHRERAILTYDVLSWFYAAPERRTGDAVRELLPPDVLGRIAFRNPATAVDMNRELATDEVGFVFLDAAHSHPHPTLDLLAALERIRPGAEIVFHDINMPLIHPEFPEWGAKWLYDGLDLEKRLNP